MEFIKNNKKEIIIFSCGFLVALLFISAAFNTVVKTEKKKIAQEVKETNKKKEKKKKEEKKTEKEENTKNQEEYNIENIKVVETTQLNDDITPPQTPTEYTNITSTDKDVIDYFEKTEMLSSDNQNNPTIRENLKEGVNNIYNFLFKDGTIKGKTFKELSNEAKLKILKITLSIDQKIDSYFPNYKERIKEGCKDLKTKAITKYLEVTNRICTEHEDICSTAKADFENMKKNFKITFDLLKEKSKESANNIKRWYYSTTS